MIAVFLFIGLGCLSKCPIQIKKVSEKCKTASNIYRFQHLFFLPGYLKKKY